MVIIDKIQIAETFNNYFIHIGDDFGVNFTEHTSINAITHHNSETGTLSTFELQHI